MKGIIKILEAMLASIILLSTISYFLVIEKESNWDDVLTQTKIKDSLATLYLNGSMENFIRNGDAVTLNSALKGLLAETLDFSIVIKGIPDYEIKLGCICDAGEQLFIRND